MTALSKVYYKSGEVEMRDHASLAEAKTYCRKRYATDPTISTWQVIVKREDKIIHYTQPEYEKR